MIKQIKICKYPNITIATFDTYAQDDNADKGRRVKHYIYKDKDSNAYWHERRYLSAIAKPKWSYGGYVSVSERLFFGKVRLVCHRDACLPETWMAIGQSVSQLEKVNKHF